VEKIGGRVWIAENFEIQITEVLNAEADTIEDLRKTEENLLNEATDSPLDDLSQRKEIFV